MDFSQYCQTTCPILQLALWLLSFWGFLHVFIVLHSLEDKNLISMKKQVQSKPTKNPTKVVTMDTWILIQSFDYNSYKKEKKVQGISRCFTESPRVTSIPYLSFRIALKFDVLLLLLFDYPTEICDVLPLTVLLLLFPLVTKLQQLNSSLQIVICIERLRMSNCLVVAHSGCQMFHCSTSISNWGLICCDIKFIASQCPESKPVILFEQLICLKS